jgi:hypothetical protein
LHWQWGIYSFYDPAIPTLVASGGGFSDFIFINFLGMKTSAVLSWL